MSAQKIREKREARRRRRREEVTEVDDAAVVEVEEENKGITAAKGHATRSRRHEVDVQPSSNFLVRTVNGLGEYFAGVRSELQKVTWPTREETINLTRLVLIVTIAMSLFLGAVSLGFTELFRIGLNNPIVLFVFMVAAIGGGLYLSRRSNQGSGPGPGF